MRRDQERYKGTAAQAKARPRHPHTPTRTPASQQRSACGPPWARRVLEQAGLFPHGLHSTPPPPLPRSPRRSFTLSEVFTALGAHVYWFIWRTRCPRRPCFSLNISTCFDHILMPRGLAISQIILVLLAIHQLRGEIVQAAPIPSIQRWSPSSCADLQDCRTIWNIVSSCIVTIFSCIWVAVHPNLPDIHDCPWKVT